MTGSENPQPHDLDSIVLDSVLLAETPADETPDHDAPALTSVAAAQADALVDRHYEVVYRYAYRLTGCQATAEDVTQETFVQAIRHLHQLRSGDAERGWLLAIARRQFMRVLRKVIHAKHGRVLSIDNPNVDVDAALCEESAKVTQRLDNEDAIQSALSQLGQDARLIVVMHYFEELSYAEIAHQLEIPIGTVMSRLSRSRDQLRKLLDESPGQHAPRSASEHSKFASPLASAPLTCNVSPEARHG